MTYTICSQAWIEWLSSGAVTGLATVILAIVTGFYVLLTFSITGSAKAEAEAAVRSVDLLERSQTLAHMPVVVGTSVRASSSPPFELTLTGQGGLAFGITATVAAIPAGREPGPTVDVDAASHWVPDAEGLQIKVNRAPDGWASTEVGHIAICRYRDATGVEYRTTYTNRIGEQATVKIERDVNGWVTLVDPESRLTRRSVEH